ncbi:hypothetical protein [Kitasatospora aureofaciens]|uniref:hypothetical protein n=1 Tax=Kitasatospora aureofaciens TaxID=1894 RepID=UPI001F39DE25|nr:hypothetical protein [Kitasatospora aureofaciens]
MVAVAVAVPLVKVTDAPETGTPLHSTTAVTLVGWPTTTGPTSGWITTEQLDTSGKVTVIGASVQAGQVPAAGVKLTVTTWPGVSATPRLVVPTTPLVTVAVTVPPPGRVYVSVPLMEERPAPQVMMVLAVVVPLTGVVSVVDMVPAGAGVTVTVPVSAPVTVPVPPVPLK